jgi:hypothetical protein
VNSGRFRADWARAIAAALLSAAVVGGCKHTTEDGVTLYKSDTTAEIRGKFGEPDLVEPATINMGGCVFKDFRRVEARYYFDRGYALFFDDDRLLDLRKLSPEGRPELERRARIKRQVSGVAPAGTPVAEAVARLGAPDLVTRIKVLDGTTFGYVSLYDPAKPVACGTVDLNYLERDAVLRAVEGVVTQARAMQARERDGISQDIAEISARRELAAQDPPCVGMESAALRERWGSPDVVSARVKGAEVITEPSFDPAARLHAEITRWYYLGSGKAVHLEGGRITSIEPIDPELMARLNSFMERRFRIARRIGRQAEERLP